MIHNLKQLILGLGALLLIAMASKSIAADIVAGKQYELMSSAIPTNADAPIQVIEFFSYGCPFCASVAPHFSAWSAEQAEDVAPIHVPVEFFPGWDQLAKVYYTAEVLGIAESEQDDFFAAVQVRKLDFTDEQVVETFFTNYAITPEQFANAFNSFSVNANLERGRQLARRYQVTSIPLIVVDGQYKTNMSMAGGPEGLKQTLDFLVAKARAERAADAS